MYIPSTAPRLELLPYHWKEVDLLLLWPQRLWVVRTHTHTHTQTHRVRARQETAGTRKYYYIKTIGLMLAEHLLSPVKTCKLQLAVHKLPHDESLECIFPGDQRKLFTVKAAIHTRKLIQRWLTSPSTQEPNGYIAWPILAYRTCAGVCWGCRPTLFFGFEEQGAENDAWGDA